MFRSLLRRGLVSFGELVSTAEGGEDRDESEGSLTVREAAEVALFRGGIIGIRDPFKQFSPEPFSESGLCGLLRHSFGQHAHGAFGDATEEMTGICGLGAICKPMCGRYSFQVAMTLSVVDKNGRIHSERFASSDVGCGPGAVSFKSLASMSRGHGGLRETHQAYFNSEAGVEKRSLEHHLGDRAHKTTKEFDRLGGETTRQLLSGMQANGVAEFEQEFNFNCGHLPAHLCCPGGFLAGFGDHACTPIPGAASCRDAAAPGALVEACEGGRASSSFLFGQHDPMNQLSQNPFSDGGICSVLSHSFGHVTEGFGDATEEVFSSGRLASGLRSFQYSLQVTAMLSFMGASSDGRPHLERFASSDVGCYQTCLREMHQAYSNSETGLEKRALEQYFGERCRKTVKDCHGNGQESVVHLLAGIEESEIPEFEHEIAMKSDRLPAHLSSPGGFLGGFGDHGSSMLSGVAPCHLDPPRQHGQCMASSLGGG